MKILWLSDNWDGHSGVGVQTALVLKGLRDRGHEVVNIAGFMGQRGGIHEDASQGIRKYSVVNSGGGGIVGIHQLRHILRKELPDVFVALHDPRLIMNAFFSDDEIKKHGPFVYWHLWDSLPYPEFNDPLYESVDSIVAISKFTERLLKDRFSERLTYIPHGINPEEYFPMEDEKREEIRSEFFEAQGVDPDQIEMVIFWNNRNMPRKRPGSLIQAVGEFAEKYPGKAAFVMHTQPNDPSGINFPAAIEKFVDTGKIKVIISPSKGQAPSYLNELMNISDVCINISMNEGFGLSTCESMFCGLPIIATNTGGLIDQLRNEESKVISGIALKPDATDVKGDQNSSLYVTEDYVHPNQVVKALSTMMDMGKEKRRAIGRRAREHAMNHFHANDVLNAWEKHLEEVVANWAQPPNFRVTTL